MPMIITQDFADFLDKELSEFLNAKGDWRDADDLKSAFGDHIWEKLENYISEQDWVEFYKEIEEEREANND